MAERVVLAYSGGLDTSVAVRWLIENEGVEVIAVAVDVGQAADKGGENWDAIRQRALAAGAVEAVVVDARAEMAQDFCVPALAANARYEGRHQRVLALVAGVGGQGRHAEVLGHLGSGVDHHGLDGPGGQGALPDGVPVLTALVGRLPDVDGDGDHLDALVLDEPTDGHRRIEATAVGQHHSLSHLQSFPCKAISLSPACLLSPAIPA